MNENCLNNYSDEDIIRYFGESDESIKKCNKCPYLYYEDGIMQCKKINKDNIHE